MFCAIYVVSNCDWYGFCFKSITNCGFSRDFCADYSIVCRFRHGAACFCCLACKSAVLAGSHVIRNHHLCCLADCHADFWPDLLLVVFVRLVFFQDICARLPRLGRRKSGWFYHYSAPMTRLRRIALFIVVLSIILGFRLCPPCLIPTVSMGVFRSMF